jgi:uncharacterized protein (DUF433 family)
MSLAVEAIPVALKTHADGVIRVGDTRVTLDTIVAAFQRGETPEVIAEQYPAVSLADVYGVIGFYLGRQEEVEAYLTERQHRRAAIRRENEVGPAANKIRDRLRQRRAAGQ